MPERFRYTQEKKKLDRGDEILSLEKGLPVFDGGIRQRPFNFLAAVDNGNKNEALLRRMLDETQSRTVYVKVPGDGGYIHSYFW